MDTIEYRSIKEKLEFPSGLVLEITPPSVVAMLTIGRKEGSDVFDLLREVEKGFPDGFTLEDIRKPEDFHYLTEWVNRFFVLTRGPEG